MLGVPQSVFLKGISHIHDWDCVHCDLKPDNIILVVWVRQKDQDRIKDKGLILLREELDLIWRGKLLLNTCKSVLQIYGPCVVLEMLTGRVALDVKRICNVEQLFCMIGNEDSLPEIPFEISDNL